MGLDLPIWTQGSRCVHQTLILRALEYDDDASNLINRNGGGIAHTGFSLYQRIIPSYEHAVRFQDSRNITYSLTRDTFIDNQDPPTRPHSDGRLPAAQVVPGPDSQPTPSAGKGDETLKAGKLTNDVPQS
jgi:hypothetical protein